MANILLVTHIYPPATDGGSKVIAKIGDYFQSQGHHTLVLTSNCHSTDEFIKHYKPLSQHNPNVIALPVYTCFRRPFKLLSPLSSLFYVCQKGPIFKLIPFIKSLITILKFKPDYIITGPLPTTIVLYARLIRFISRVLAHQRTKLIINPCFHPTDRSFQQSILINTLKSADFIWTQTDFETNYFNKNFNIPKSTMISVGSGIDSSFLIKNCEAKRSPSQTEKFKIKNSPNLLFIGSFAAHKSLETLINAFCLLSSPVTLTLAGQPTLYSPIIENKINSLPSSIKSRIKIIYNFKSNALTNLLDQSTVLISPSTQESFGLVLIEAWARSKPVIAADIPASKELIVKTNGGLMFKQNNPQDLSEKISLLLKSPDLLTTFGQNGYNYVATHYIWAKIGKLLWQKISS